MLFPENGDNLINRNMKKYLLLFFCFCSLSLAAQEEMEVNEQDYRNNTVEMADALRADGKIYVVVAILLVLFAGFVGYVIRIDGKISRLEKEMAVEEANAKTVV